MVAWAKKTVHKILPLLLGILAVWWAAAAATQDPAATPAPQKGKRAVVKLFGTIEFRSSIKALPQWVRVLSIAPKQVHAYQTCKGRACAPEAGSWQQMMQQSRRSSQMETLKAVNAFINRWPYRLDIEAYGKSDHWASPKEFLKGSGDCEDYSIIKYFALKALGFDETQMRIVVVKDRIRNIGHAVLAVYMEDTAYILDNLSNMVLPHSKYQHYIPQYSVNGVNRWAHIRPIGKQGF